MVPRSGSKTSLIKSVSQPHGIFNFVSILTCASLTRAADGADESSTAASAEMYADAPDSLSFALLDSRSCRMGCSLLHDIYSRMPELFVI